MCKVSSFLIIFQSLAEVNLKPYMLLFLMSMPLVRVWVINVSQTFTNIKRTWSEIFIWKGTVFCGFCNSIFKALFIPISNFYILYTILQTELASENAKKNDACAYLYNVLPLLFCRNTTY